MNLNNELVLDINGLGIIMYSDFATSFIKEGEDYFCQNYETPQQVLKHIIEGTIVGFCTSSSGRYILKLKTGYPSEENLNSSEFKLRLGIKITDKRMYIRDLYDLMDWSSNCPSNQCVELENGFYHITLLGNTPNSGILGDNQVIYIYFKKLNHMPKLHYEGVPMFSE